MAMPAQKRKHQRLPAPAELEIQGLSHDGRGIARHQGKTVFVRGALPGERVQCEFTHSRRDFDQGRATEVIQASPDRIVPRCPHFGLCGGCSLQHLAPPAQVAHKQRSLLDNLERIGGVQPARVLDPLTGPEWNYRRRARLGVRYVRRKRRLLVGFREADAPHVAEMDSCEILAEPLGRLIASLARLIEGLSIKEDVPQVEVAVAEGAVALVLRVLVPPADDDVERLQAFAREHAVEFYLQSGGAATIVPIDAATPLAYAIPDFDIELQFEPSDFVQINASINSAMIARAIELLEFGPDQSVLDLFCGLGNFTLPLARRVGEIVGVEGDTALVSRARANAERNGIENATFHVANLFEPEANAAWLKRGYDRILLDPPRAGAREILPFLTRTGATRMVYVSCHPATLARDTGVLVKELGWKLAAAGVMDMFPHTTHVESIAVFERKG